MSRKASFITLLIVAILFWTLPVTTLLLVVDQQAAPPKSNIFEGSSGQAKRTQARKDW